MPVLSLTKTFVNLLATGDAVSAQSAPGRDSTYSQAGEVRSYVGGRQRAVTVAGERGTYGFTLLLVPMTDITKLRTWIGQTVQVRDWRGQVFYGVFFEVIPHEVVSNPTRWHVALTLHVVTAAAGV